MKKAYRFLSVVALVLCTGCSKADLSVRSEYYNREHLASSVMDTPDPRKESSAFGQRLIINWSVPNEIFKQGPLELVLKVRLQDGEEKDTKILLKKSFGQTFYPIFGNDFTKKGGLQSYYAELLSNGKKLAKSRHKLWVEKINITQ